MRIRILLTVASVLMLTLACKKEKTESQLEVQGWCLLSNNEAMAMKAIERAKDYHINHLELSHELVMDLRELRNPDKLSLVNKLIKAAHKNNIEEVSLWDHALYSLEYYPKEFRTGPGGTIDLDNVEFWKWFKQDYRSMLDLVPDADGIVLTFIETGARIEQQYSVKMKTAEEKYAALVDTLASVIIDEREKYFYVRTFAYNPLELQNMIQFVNMLKHDGITVMIKEVPHDFFLTHPVAEYASQINKPFMVEFDCAHEYNGQSIIASVTPQITLDRFEFFKKQKNFIGYVARIDRYGKTSIIDKPSEVNIITLNQAFEKTDITIDSILNQFISMKYGRACIPLLKNVFIESSDILSSTLYTLGLNNSNHSSLDFEHESSYSRHVPVKWTESQLVTVKHDVYKKYHAWKDIVEHLGAPAMKKRVFFENEAPYVLDSNWVTTEEMMDMDYLNDVLIEKENGVSLSRNALRNVIGCKSLIRDSASYYSLYHMYYRTYLTSKLYRSTAKVYFGYRVYSRGGEFALPELRDVIISGLTELKETIERIREYEEPGPVGQYDWVKDTDKAMEYYTHVKFGIMRN